MFLQSVSIAVLNPNALPYQAKLLRCTCIMNVPFFTQLQINANYALHVFSICYFFLYQYEIGEKQVATLKDFKYSLNRKWKKWRKYKIFFSISSFDLFQYV